LAVSVSAAGIESIQTFDEVVSNEGIVLRRWRKLKKQTALLKKLRNVGTGPVIDAHRGDEGGEGGIKVYPPSEIWQKPHGPSPCIFKPCASMEQVDQLISINLPRNKKKTQWI
jgi:hypothetical protein